MEDYGFVLVFSKETDMKRQKSVYLAEVEKVGMGPLCLCSFCMFILLLGEMGL